MPDQYITINSRKYDQRIRRSWTGGLISQNDKLLVIVGRFEFDVEHDDLGLIRQGTISFEHYWLDRWYNVFRFHEPDGSLRNYYCNITMPPTFENGVLDFVDLDIDVVVWLENKYEILDRDDFERNTVKFGYPSDVVDNTEASLAEVTRLVERREFPFTTEFHSKHQFQI